MSEKKYRWANPYEWLEEKSHAWDANRLRVELLELAIKHDPDTLQDIYGSDMGKDGYFSVGGGRKCLT